MGLATSVAKMRSTEKFYDQVTGAH